MSGDYIRKAVAINKIMENIVHQDSHDVNLHNIGLRKAMSAIDSLPAADVVEVKHGRWIQKGRKIYCSKCNRGVYIGTDDEGVMQDEMRLRHFCSACGAKMDGGQDE